MASLLPHCASFFYYSFQKVRKWKTSRSLSFSNSLPRFACSLFDKFPLLLQIFVQDVQHSKWDVFRFPSNEYYFNNKLTSLHGWWKFCIFSKWNILSEFQCNLIYISPKSRRNTISNRNTTSNVVILFEGHLFNRATSPVFHFEKHSWSLPPRLTWSAAVCKFHSLLVLARNATGVETSG